MKNSEERRKHARHDVVQLITVINTNTKRKARGCLEDMSIGGASLLTYENLAGWDNIIIQMPELDIKAEIIRDESIGGNRVVGVKFVGLGFFEKRKLKKFIQSNAPKEGSTGFARGNSTKNSEE